METRTERFSILQVGLGTVLTPDKYKPYKGYFETLIFQPGNRNITTAVDSTKPQAGDPAIFGDFTANGSTIPNWDVYTYKSPDKKRDEPNEYM